jgi:hypothetical protein
MTEEKNTKNKPGAFYKWRLKWMPFANLSVMGIAVYGLFQLPFVELNIVEPYASASISESSSVPTVANPFTLRVNIEKTMGCDFTPSTIKAVVKSADGLVIEIDDITQDDKGWLASNIDVPLGEYLLEVSVEANCWEPEIVSDSMHINVVCVPLTVAKAKANGDVCGEHVADHCGGYVKLDSCENYGVNDPRVINEKLNCSQSGYYVGKSASKSAPDGGAGNYYTALQCGSENNSDCYDLPSAPGMCRYSKSPEDIGFYGSKDDSSFHKCKVECR